MEVVIEGSRGLNVQICDDNLARAIGKAPAGRGALLVQYPGSLNLGAIEIVNPRERLAE